MKEKAKFKKTIVLFILFIQLFISFSIPWLNQLIIDEILTQKKFSFIKWISCIYLCFAFFNIALSIILPQILVKMKEAIIVELRLKLTESLQKEEKSEFPMSERGNILTLYEQDLNKIAHFLSYGIKECIFQLLSLLITIIVLLSVNLKIGLLALCVIPFYIILPAFFTENLKKINQSVQEKTSEINSMIQEILNGILQIRVFNQQSFFLNRLNTLSQDATLLKVRQETIQKLASSTLIVYWLVMLLVLWIGGSQVIKGSLTVGVLLVLINYIDRIEWPVTCLIELYGEYQSYAISKNRFSQTINETALLEEEEMFGSIESLVLEKLSYRYEGNRKDTINELFLEIKKGDSIGIVGASGSGKTTLIRLLLGLLKSQEGQILVNQKKLSSLSLTDYREKIAYFTQESYLFEMTLYENIIFGINRAVSVDEVYSAAKEAEIHHFILSLNQGYQTIYGKNGFKLSQGQKQRIALARIFLRDSDVIILDEPTANLDSKNTEYVFKNLLRKYQSEKIIILISHNLSLIENLDTVYCLNNGKLIFNSQMLSELESNK